MRVFVFGTTGQVAHSLLNRAPKGWLVAAAARGAVDLTNPGACARLISEIDTDAVINAAAYTAVDKAEEEEALATEVNAAAPAAMARAAAARGLPFVHLSTDYVFDGSGDRPWRPDDRPAPLSAYGRSKLAGEVAVRDAGGTHAILRTSWVFSAQGQNFVKSMLRLSETRDRLSVVADQTGGPTPAAAIAEAIFAIARGLVEAPEKSGTDHFAGAPDATWADFACEIFAQAGRKTAVEEIPTSDYPTPARRPLNSRLDCATLSEFGLFRPDWRRGLADVLTELGVRP
jgi:dTDP-4-dehydrorhamnose reductase